MLYKQLCEGNNHNSLPRRAILLSNALIVRQRTQHRRQLSSAIAHPMRERNIEEQMQGRVASVSRRHPCRHFVKKKTFNTCKYNINGVKRKTTALSWWPIECCCRCFFCYNFWRDQFRRMLTRTQEPIQSGCEEDPISPSSTNLLIRD